MKDGARSCNISSMRRFVLSFHGALSAVAEDLARISAFRDVRVLDSWSPRMLLIETTGECARALVDILPDWDVVPEQHIPLPDTRPRPRTPAGS
jgi:hypothetical protein